MLSKIFSTVRYSLITINFLFLITGIIILAVGSSVQSSYNVYHVALTERFFSLPAFCIATGIIIFLLAFLGFYGAYTESYYMNIAFAAAMVLMFIFQLSACIAGYALRNNAVSIIHQSLLETMPEYQPPNNNFFVTKFWDDMQTEFECCGVTQSVDWVKYVNQPEAVTEPTEGNTDPQGLPLSCCTPVYGAVDVIWCNTTSTNLFTDGCGPVFGVWVQGHVASIGIAGVFLVLIQALAMGGAIWIATKSRTEYIG